MSEEPSASGSVSDAGANTLTGATAGAGEAAAGPVLDRRAAVRFVVLLGLVSLFADLTYEGARSITGPFLATLGASGLVVGGVAGGGELIGYGVRLLSGRLADRTGRMWAMTIGGYAINLVAVPFLALAGNWPVAAALMIGERVGKGIRVPPRDAMLSHATDQTGRGWGFGLHEAMDQIGAVAGPLLVAAVLASHHQYKAAFAMLAIPAVCALAVLVVARMQYPHPKAFERPAPTAPDVHGYAPTFWWYLLAASLFAAGFADFSLIAFHFQRSHLIRPDAIPVLYALAMATDGAAALVLGRLFDRVGLIAVAGASLVAASFAPLVFTHSAVAAIVGVAIWGIGMGSQESVMRAAVADMVPADRRASGYGVFNAGFGIAWFGGSLLIGGLYDWSRPGLIAFSITAQLLAVPVLWWVHRQTRRA